MASVLIYEDEPAVGRLLSLTFGLEGHEVEVVADGDEGARRLDGPVPDLLILDVMLPGRDGLDLLKDLRGRPTWDGCRVVVLTALADDRDVWRGWASGADYYLTKPFDVDHLREVCDRLLRDEDLDVESAG